MMPTEHKSNVERKWELIENGYHRRQRYVEFPSGLIVGGVSGSPHDDEGWEAFTDGPKGTESVGTYVTEALAKRAVEAANDVN